MLITVLISYLCSMQAYSQNVSFNVAPRGVQTFNTEDKVGRNQVIFYSKAPLEEIFGAAADVSGKIALDPTSVEKTIKGEIVIQAKSMTTGLKQRDRDMLGEDWLDVGRYPTIKFKLKKLSNTTVVKKEQIDGIATGDFTMHGVTRTLSVPITLTYLEESPETQKRAPGDLLALRSKFTVNFEDYNVAGVKKFFGWRVAKQIELTVAIFASNKVSPQEPDRD